MEDFSLVWQIAGRLAGRTITGKCCRCQRQLNFGLWARSPPDHDMPVVMPLEAPAQRRESAQRCDQRVLQSRVNNSTNLQVRQRATDFGAVQGCCQSR